MARGNARARVYRGHADYEFFLETVAHTVERYGWICHAYCLLANHYHLVVETPQANLPRGMRQLNGLYARRFNLRHGRCGHVFQARYRAIVVEKESHLLTVCRYVERNPVRAGIVDDPGDYRWSSYRARVGLEPPPRFLTTDEVLAGFAPTRALAQARYCDFVRSGDDEGLDEQARGERLGSEAFLSERFGLDPPIAEIPRVQVEPLPPPLADIFEREALPVLVAYRRHGYTLAEIARHLGKHYSTASRRLKREEAAERALRECKT